MSFFRKPIPCSPLTAPPSDAAFSAILSSTSSEYAFHSEGGIFSGFIGQGWRFPSAACAATGMRTPYSLEIFSINDIISGILLVGTTTSPVGTNGSFALIASSQFLRTFHIRSEALLLSATNTSSAPFAISAFPARSYVSSSSSLLFPSNCMMRYAAALS